MKLVEFETDMSGVGYGRVCGSHVAVGTLAEGQWPPTLLGCLRLPSDPIEKCR